MKTCVILPVLAAFTVLFFGIIQLAASVPAAPSPTCEITAKVLGVENAKTTTWGYYNVSLLMSGISTYEQEGSPSCDASYMKSAEGAGQLLSQAEYDKTPVRKGQIIKAKIHYEGDEIFHGFFLSDVHVVEDTVNQSATTGFSYWPYVILGIGLLFVLYRRFKGPKAKV